MTALLPVRARYVRSVHLERDLWSDGALDGYVVTGEGRRVLARLAAALRGTSADRAFTLTGPYGTGKSAFTLFFSRLVGDASASNDAWARLRAADPALAEEYAALLVRPLLPVVVTGRRTAASDAILEGLLTATKRVAPHNDLVRALEGDLRDAGDGRRDTRTLVRRVTELADLGEHAGGYGGVVLIADELGKIFEHAARFPDEGDTLVLQELAEAASRSADRPVLFVGVLHQDVEEYGRHLDRVERQEWAKVQGRFAPLPFLEPVEQLMRLVGDAVDARDLDAYVLRSVQGAVDATYRAGLTPPSMGRDEFTQLAERAYPLHPATLVLLPHLFRRFAQNERSLFSFLASNEPFALPDARRRLAGGDGFVRPPALFDYFLSSLGTLLFRERSARRWVETVDALDRAPDLEPLQADALKTIGLLSVLSEATHLRADAAAVSASLGRDEEDAAVRAALETLERRTLVSYRRYNQSYRVFEGSDLDVEARLEEARRVTTGRLGLAATLAKYVPPRPLIARRHSFKTGATRFFDVVYVDDPQQLEDAARRKTDADGVVLCGLAETAAQHEAFVARVAEPALQARHVVVALPRQIRGLTNAAAELRALAYLKANTPELEHDRTAKREVAERTAEVELDLARTLAWLLDPRPEPRGSHCTWYRQGATAPVRDERDVSVLLSQVMDDVYELGPTVRNELVNRRALSSAATAARRELIRRMLEHAGEPLLGITGYPPERSMFESVLHDTGVYAERPDGTWGFAEPHDGHRTRLRPTWDRLAARVFEKVEQPVPVAGLASELAAAPYGLTAGMFPLVLCALLLVRRDEVSLYRDNTFLVDPSLADFEVLMRKPEAFAVGGARLDGAHRRVVERISRSTGSAASITGTSRYVVRMLKSLPDYAQRTRTVSDEARNIINAAFTARSPERLLFHDLPMALGELPFTDGTVDDDRIDRFFTRLNDAIGELRLATPRLVKAARDDLLAYCGFEAGTAGFETLRDAARRLERAGVGPELLTFVQRLAGDEGTEATVANVLALINKRPPGAWTDADFDAYRERARGVAAAFQRALRELDGAAIQTAAPPTARRAPLDKTQKKLKQKLVDGAWTTLQATLDAADAAVRREALKELQAQIQKRLEAEETHD